jgi:hypothetical protein
MPGGSAAACDEDHENGAFAEGVVDRARLVARAPSGITPRPLFGGIIAWFAPCHAAMIRAPNKGRHRFMRPRRGRCHLKGG